MRLARLLPFTLAAVLGARTLAAQDSFELEVYGHDTAKPGEWELEPHLAFTGKGTPNHLLRSSLEITHGLTGNWEIAAYGLFAMPAGNAPIYAGWRVRSRVSSPDAWSMPVDLALNVEMEYTRPIFDDHSHALEIVPIASHRWGAFEAVINGAFEVPLNGPDKGKWEFEPSARGAFNVSRSVDLTLEYFSALGPINAMDPVREQVHQLYPGMVLHFGDDFSWRSGIGLGLTGSGDRIVAKTAFELEL